jgi:hypothetical protein
MIGAYLTSLWFVISVELPAESSFSVEALSYSFAIGMMQTVYPTRTELLMSLNHFC